MKKFLVLLTIIISIVGVCFLVKKEKSLELIHQKTVIELLDETQKTPIGGNKDESGCYTSAGYSWCEPKQRCLREWEETCN